MVNADTISYVRPTEHHRTAVAALVGMLIGLTIAVMVATGAELIDQGGKLGFMAISIMMVVAMMIFRDGVLRKVLPAQEFTYSSAVVAGLLLSIFIKLPLFVIVFATCLAGSKNYRYHCGGMLVASMCGSPYLAMLYPDAFALVSLSVAAGGGIILMMARPLVLLIWKLGRKAP